MDTPNALAPRPPLPLLGPVTVRCRARSRCPRRDGHDHSRGCQRRCPAGHRGHWAVPGGAGRVNPTMVTTTRFLAGSGESKINMKYTLNKINSNMYWHLYLYDMLSSRMILWGKHQEFCPQKPSRPGIIDIHKLGGMVAAIRVPDAGPAVRR